MTTATTENERLAAALGYAARGWRVHPLHSIDGGACTCQDAAACESPGKHPRLTAWQDKATTDAAIIRAWWRQWPTANVGITTGAASGFIALDIDPRHGGDDGLRELQDEHGRLPATVESMTGGGGQHILFAHPGRHVKCRTGKDPVAGKPGVECKGDGGYIVAPPSNHASGNVYTWELSSEPGALPLAELPAWLLDELTRDGQKPTTGTAPAIGETIPKGQRNATLTSLAGTMRRRGMGESALLAALKEENAARCEPPLPDDAVVAIAKSVARYAPAPRAAATAPASPAPSSPAELPEIVTTGRPLRDVTADALDALANANASPAVFVRSGELTRITTNEHNLPVIDGMNEAAVRGRMERCAQFTRLTKRKDDDAAHIPMAPPIDVVRDVMALGAWPFPPLVGIIEAPSLRPDGSLLTAAGYDAATRLYHIPAPGLHVPAIPDRPTAGERAAALELLREIVIDFPFEDEASRANALAAMITPVVRPLIAGPVPMVIFDKPQSGTGASLLAEVVALVSTGRPSAMFTAPADDEGWKKEITSLLLQGRTVITVDNIEGRLFSPSLAAVLTATMWEDRLLGVNKSATLLHRSVWIGTGNNIRLGGDLPRRCYWVRMDAQEARPWERTGFAHPDLCPWVTHERGRILAAILTLARAWVVDKPAAPQHTLGSFEGWAAVLGGILAHAGVSGFLGNLQAMYEQADDDTPQWELFLDAWRGKWQGEYITAQQLAKALEGDETLRQALPTDLADYTDKGFTRRLGHALTRRKGMRFPNGLCLKRGKAEQRANTWAVLPTEPKK